MVESFSTIQLDFDEDLGIGRLILDRPSSLNALSDELRQDIAAGFEALATHDQEQNGVAVRAVILEGAGDRAFCAGADLNEFSGNAVAQFTPSQEQYAPYEFPAPVIAKIQGYCLGGGLELALLCDFRITTPESQFGMPEVDIGTISSGALQRLTRILGPSRTKELGMTGSYIDGQQAASEGIADRVVPREELDTTVTAFAEELASKAPLAVRAVKQAVHMAQETGHTDGWLYEHTLSASLTTTADHDEGLQAWKEDRDPDWTGR